jgi:hypothetical protein
MCDSAMMLGTNARAFVRTAKLGCIIHESYTLQNMSWTREHA